MQRRNTISLNGKSTVDQAVEYYYRTPQFRALRSKTQKSYEQCLRIACADLGNIKLSRLSTTHCKSAYQNWLQRGVRTANITATVMSVVFRMPEELEALMRNPLKNVKRMKEKPRKIMWTQDQVKTFLDRAYSDFKWRNIGLIAHMAYEFAQRVGDMRLLEWDNLNLPAGVLSRVQSKRRAEVSMPIQKDLLEMLRQQEKDFGFQKYVAPCPMPKNGAYRAYLDVEVSPIMNTIKAACGLPSELQAMDMRRTAITEMVEAGVDTTQIMAVSGHNSPNSMSPYLKHTYTSANNALSRRGEYKNA